MEIRIVEDSELQSAYLLSAQAFRGGHRDDRFAERRLSDKNRTKSTMFGVYDDAGLQAKVVVIPYRQVFGTQYVVSMGGIGGVACLPASRGKGYARACLQHALQFMRDTGMCVSTLYPFAWEFYRRLGWEWIGAQRSYNVPTRVMSAVPGTERVRAATPNDRAAIAQLYAEYSRRYRGMAERDERTWNAILDDSESEYTYTYLYESLGTAQGYLTFQGGAKESTRLNEFITLTPDAQQALLGLLKRHEMQTDAFRWNAPDDDSLWSNLYHGDISTRVAPVVQARIVDFAAAFRALEPQEYIDGRVLLQIRDDEADWNSGTWCVTISSGAVEVSRVDKEPDVECDIQAITQAYYGYPNLSAVRDAGRLRVNDSDGFQLLSTVLNGPTVWLNDHF